MSHGGQGRSGGAAPSIGQGCVDLGDGDGDVTPPPSLPLVSCRLFNVYRSVVDPRAKFGDAVFAFAALILLGNIVSIAVFKIRLF